jgi:hypothetical protein
MKFPSCLLLAVLLATTARAQSQNLNRGPGPDVTPGSASTIVNVPTTASELAAGYAVAINNMTLKTLIIYLRSEGKIVPIKGIRSARAMSAVLLIEFSAGDRMAVNSEHIIMITDGNRTP